MHFFKGPLLLLAMGCLALSGCANQPITTKPSLPCHASGRTRSLFPSDPVPSASVNPSPSVPSSLSPVSITGGPVDPLPSAAAQTASILGKHFVVLETSPAHLTIENPSSVHPPSLFEEAIALNKVRGKLRSNKNLSSDISAKTTLRDGTVTIPFVAVVAPIDAANVITEILMIPGIQKVIAHWGAQ